MWSSTKWLNLPKTDSCRNINAPSTRPLWMVSSSETFSKIQKMKTGRPLLEPVFKFHQFSDEPRLFSHSFSRPGWLVAPQGNPRDVFITKILIFINFSGESSWFWLMTNIVLIQCVVSEASHLRQDSSLLSDVAA